MKKDFVSKKEIKQILIPIGIVIFLLLMIFLSQQFFIPRIKKQASLAMIKNHSLSVGDPLVFGNDEWNNTWRVLKIEDGKALLINKECVDLKNRGGFLTEVDPHLSAFFMSFEYIPEDAEITHAEYWNYTGLKKWLNGEYYDNAFSQSEKDYILDNGYGNVYILSGEEVEEYIPNAAERITKCKNWAPMPWWLRSSADYDSFIYNDYVGQSGGITDRGIISPESNIGVRPVIWIKY